MRSPVALATRFDRTYGRRAHADLISGAVMKCASGEENRILITLPPQSGKSTTAAVAQEMRRLYIRTWNLRVSVLNQENGESTYLVSTH